MWLFAPWTSSRSQREPVGSDAESPSRSAPSDCEAELSVHVNGKLARRPRSWRGWNTRQATAFLFGTMREPSSPDGAEDWNRWMSSAADIPVSRFLTPADAVAAAIRDTFGRRAVASLQDSNPASCFWKMSKDTSAWAQAKSCGIAEVWAIALRADCIARRKSAGRTCGSGCSSLAWQTPSCADSKKRIQGLRPGQIVLDGEVEQWATPRVGGNAGSQMEDRNKCNIDEQATNWPTASARDHKGRLPMDARDRTMATLDEAAEQMFACSRPTEPTTDDGLSLLQAVWTRPSRPRLSPAFQWWLMGQCPTPIYSALEAIACARCKPPGPLSTSSRALWNQWWTANVQALCSLVRCFAVAERSEAR